MDFEYFGKCTCGSTKIVFSLSIKINGVVPRACDCDFCSSRNIAYLSHPDGELLIQSTGQLVVNKQGSNQADFLTCQTCQDVIAVSFKFTDKYVGALNSKVLDTYSTLLAAEIVSPKKLQPNEKLERWKALWSKVRITTHNSV